MAEAASATARLEQQRWSAVSARWEAATWKSRFEASSRKRREAEEEAARSRRVAKDALGLEGEVSRLTRLLEQAGVDSRRGTMMSLRRAVSRLGKLLAQSDEDRARLRRLLGESRAHVDTLEATLATQRGSAAVLSGTLYGRRSEKQSRPGSGRRRGQQPGSAGHGRTPRAGLEARVEVHEASSEARVCASCGTPYVSNGADESSLLEIEVRAYRRVIRRPRWRRRCGCASSPVAVSAPPVARLFPHTPYGTSVWSRLLYERYVCRRPLHRVAGWLDDQGLPVAAGTLADSAVRFERLFKPLGESIRARLNEAPVRHADETVWRVQALRAQGRSGRAWLWTAIGDDAVCFHIDPSRSAEAAQTLLGDLASGTVIVCDRYSAYKRLARLLGGTVTLQFCWAHMRRDFIHGAAGQPDLAPWCQAWLDRIAAIYRLNDARLAHHAPGAARQSPAFEVAQAALAAALDGLFADAERELGRLPKDAREGKALRSLLNHRQGLTVFVDRPRVPLDNNLAERMLRGPAIGRRLSFGSDAEAGARFTALMYSVVGTLNLNGIDVCHWLTDWLAACANHGGPPDDLSPWLPWCMNQARRQNLTAPA